MNAESGVSFEARNFEVTSKQEQGEDNSFEELVSGSEAQIEDRIDIWREILREHYEKKIAINGQVGPDINFVLKNKDGNEVPVTEKLTSDGYSYHLGIFSNGKEVAFLRYVSGSGSTPINMGKTIVDPDFRRLGLNTLLFRHMTALHPESTEVWSKMDDDNFMTYLDALKMGKSPVEAINMTPAGKVRIHAGWVLDVEQSKLPVLNEDKGVSGIRPVYKRKSSEGESP